MSLELNTIGTLVWENNKNHNHREDGPAVISTAGYIYFYFNNKLHRPDGPAIIFPDGSKHYYIHGKEYTKEEYWAKVKEL